MMRSDPCLETPGQKVGWEGLAPGAHVAFQAAVSGSLSKELRVGKVLVNQRAEKVAVVQPYRAKWSGAALQHIPQYQDRTGYCDDARGEAAVLHRRQRLGGIIGEELASTVDLALALGQRFSLFTAQQSTKLGASFHQLIADIHQHGLARLKPCRSPDFLGAAGGVAAARGDAETTPRASCSREQTERAPPRPPTC